MDFKKLAKEYAATSGETLLLENAEISTASPTTALDRKLLTKLAAQAERKRRRLNIIRAAASIVVLITAGIWVFTGLNNHQRDVDYATEQAMPMAMPDAPTAAAAEGWYDAGDTAVDGMEMWAGAIEDISDDITDLIMSMSPLEEAEAEAVPNLEFALPAQAAPPASGAVDDGEADMLFGLHRQSRLQLAPPEGWERFDSLEFPGNYRFVSDTGVYVFVQFIPYQELNFTDMLEETDYVRIFIGEFPALLHDSRQRLFVDYDGTLLTLYLNEGSNYSYMIELAQWLLR